LIIVRPVMGWGSQKQRKTRGSGGSAPPLHQPLGAVASVPGCAAAVLRSQRFWLAAILITMGSRVFVSVTHGSGAGAVSHLGGLLRHGRAPADTDADVDVYGAGVEDVGVRGSTEGSAGDHAVHPQLTSGARLVDYVAMGDGVGGGHKKARGFSGSGNSGGSRGGPADVNVRGNAPLPRGTHRAWVSRIAADLRPSHRYKHMATVARLGSRYVVAWQASAVYEGHSDQRVYHTFSRDSQVRNGGGGEGGGLGSNVRVECEWVSACAQSAPSPADVSSSCYAPSAPTCRVPPYLPLPKTA
jgi:hypothetical protein